jgi:Protein of unknown function (DUF1203)
MNFQVLGLRKELFQSLVGMSDADLSTRNVARRVAEKSATSRYPCRVSLKDAEAGESVLLVNFEHLDVKSPYRSSYAIYVRENAEEVQLATDQIPEVMQHRPLSLRSFDADGMLVDADLAQGDNLVPTINRMLNNARADYLHVHNAKHGCFVARVNRS